MQSWAVYLCVEPISKLNGKGIEIIFHWHTYRCITYTPSTSSYNMRAESLVLCPLLTSKINALHNVLLRRHRNLTFSVGISAYGSWWGGGGVAGVAVGDWSEKWREGQPSQTLKRTWKLRSIVFFKGTVCRDPLSSNWAKSTFQSLYSALSPSVADHRAIGKPSFTWLRERLPLHHEKSREKRETLSDATLYKAEGRILSSFGSEEREKLKINTPWHQRIHNWHVTSV